MRLTREFYIPKNAAKVTDKKSDAVAYLYDNGHGPCAAIFFGKQAKPIVRARYATIELRATFVRDHFNNRAAALAHKANLRAIRAAKGRGVEIGHVLAASWGYDQTNVNFYQVVELVGRTQAIVRPVSGISVGEANRPGMTDKVVPQVDAFTGDGRKVVIREGRCKIGHLHASVWNGSPMYTSSYA